MNAQVPPVVIPAVPVDPEDAFLHILEHFIGLDTVAKRERVTVTAGVRTIDDIMYVKIDRLIGILTANTSVITATRLKTLKQWAEDEYDLEGFNDVGRFTTEVCRERQRTIAQTTKTGGTTGERSADTKATLPNFNGKRENWLKSKRELTAHLNQINNEIGIPFFYVIRDPQEEARYRESNGDVGRKIYEAPFHGRIYDTDAFKV
jgi:hypothetical protein